MAAFGASLRKRSYNSMVSTKEFLAEFMGIWPSLASNKLRHILVDLRSRPQLEIKETPKTLDRLGFSWNDIVANMEVFALSPSAIKQRHASLLEIGLGKIQAPEILRFNGIVSQNKTALVAAGFLRSDSDPIGHLLERMRVPSSFSCSIKDFESTPLQAVREGIVAHIINSKLGFAGDLARDLFKQCVPLQSSCLAYVDETMDVLKNDLRLKEQIRRHPVVLSVPPEDLRCLFDVTGEYNLNIRQMAIEKPRVLCINPVLVRQTCRHLTEYGIPTDVITRSPAFFDNDPDHVLDGLRALSVWPGFDKVKCDADFHVLLSAYESAIKRLRYLEQDSPEQCSLEDLMTRDVSFRTCMLDIAREGAGGYGRDLVAYLADRLNCSYDEVLANIREHPNVTSTSVTMTRNTVAYLLDEQRFTRTQILKGLPLVLHPRDTVERIIDELPELELVQPYDEWKDNPNFLHLVLYFAEKTTSRDHTFVEGQEDVV